MKQYAVCITSREHADLIDVESPSSLGTNEIRGKTLCTLVSPGTELACNYTGETFPSFPGYAAVFQADEIGSEIKDVTVGDLLFCMGPHRSFQQVDGGSVLQVPLGLLPEKAVLARLMGITMTTLMTTTARPGDRVMVMGAGPVGFLASQIFVLSGFDVLVIEPNDERRQQVERSGIQKTYSSVPVEDPGITGTVALVVECSGHEQAVLDACTVVRKLGEVVLVGVPWHRHTEAYAHELLSLIFHKYVVLRSGWEWQLPFHSSEFNLHSIFSGFETALKWLAADRIACEDLITLVNPQDAQLAYQDLFHRRARGLFTVFDWKGIKPTEGEV